MRVPAAVLMDLCCRGVNASFLTRGAAVLVYGATLVLADYAGTPGELDNSVVFGNMIASHPISFERWEFEDSVMFEDPSDPGSVVVIDFLKGSNASVWRARGGAGLSPKAPMS